MISNRDNNLWLKFWRDQRDDFHQVEVNALLIKFWPKLDANQQQRVLVPLCGKSLDMLWLAEQGYNVLGIELSPVAVKAFFLENHLVYQRKQKGKFRLWVSGKISILCGDYFALKKSDLGQIDHVYDKAALTALPEDIRKLYVKQLRLILPDVINVFLLTTEDDDTLLNEQNELEIDSEINSLFSDDFNIMLAHVEASLHSNPEPVLYKLYHLSTKNLSS